MVKFEEETYLDNVRGALALRGQIEAIVDAAAGQCGNLCWLGIGGTWASCLQTTVHMKERSAMEVFALNAAEYNTTGDRRVGERTFVVISSVTGTTEEMCAAVEKLHAAGRPGAGVHRQGGLPPGPGGGLVHQLPPQRAAEILHDGGPVHVPPGRVQRLRPLLRPAGRLSAGGAGRGGKGRRRVWPLLRQGAHERQAPLFRGRWHPLRRHLLLCHVLLGGNALDPHQVHSRRGVLPRDAGDRGPGYPGDRVCWRGLPA